MGDLFKDVDRTALTAHRNKKNWTENVSACVQEKGECVGVASSSDSTSDHVENWILFVLNSPFNLRMKLPNDSIYLSVTCGLFKKLSLYHLFHFILWSRRHAHVRSYPEMRESGEQSDTLVLADDPSEETL